MALRGSKRRIDFDSGNAPTGLNNLNLTSLSEENVKDLCSKGSRDSRTRILKDLFDMGLKGNMPNFISNFLSNRHFNVRVNSTMSNLYDQEMGVPQGSILSVTLFSLKINSLVEVLKSNIEGSLYVDDFFNMSQRQKYE